jgi:formylglycine-generating enzyme required for sulfatase activity
LYPFEKAKTQKSALAKNTTSFAYFIKDSGEIDPVLQKLKKRYTSIPSIQESKIVTKLKSIDTHNNNTQESLKQIVSDHSETKQNINDEITSTQDSINLHHAQLKNLNKQIKELKKKIKKETKKYTNVANELTIKQQNLSQHKKMQLFSTSMIKDMVSSNAIEDIKSQIDKLVDEIDSSLHMVSRQITTQVNQGVTTSIEDRETDYIKKYTYAKVLPYFRSGNENARMGAVVVLQAQFLLKYDEFSNKPIDKGTYIIPAMVKIKAKNQSFMMGSNDGDNDEKPVHKVSFKKDFYMGKYEVTVGEFRKFVNDTSYITEAEKNGCTNYEAKYGWTQADLTWEYYVHLYKQTESDPVLCISWHDAKAYTKWLSKKTGKKYRLPSEAEWEYSARAGTVDNYSFKDENNIDDYAWHASNSVGKSHKVGLKKPNRWGLYDIHGNAWEWCEDGYVNSYTNTPRNGSENNSGTKKVLRGGSWFNDEYRLRVAGRKMRDPSNSSYYNGFRLVGEP